MTETFSGTGLLILWITFTAVALTGATAVLVWAVRTKQFSNQDEARYLPLKSGIPRAPATRSAGKPPKRENDQSTEAGHAAP